MARPSHVRDAIAELLGSSRRHDWSIEEVAGALARRDVAADFSSVFRGLTRLERDGAVRRVALGDGRARYEASHEHHEHVRCEDCGRVAAVPGCVVDAARPGVEDATGFRITGHQVLFSGVCPSCAQTGGR